VPGSAAGSASELADYTLVKDVRGGPDGFTCYAHAASGGNPDAYAHVTIEPEGGQIIACMFKAGAVYDPSTSGAFAYVDFSVDGICFPAGGPQCMSTGPCLRQGGNLYVASAGFTPTATWAPSVAYGVGPSEFSWLSGPASSVPPDFSTGGGPIEIGFYRAKSGGPGTETGADNWRLLIQSPCPSDAACDDADPCTTEVCSGGICERSAMDCSDGDDCTQDVCSSGVCSHPPLVCNDGDDCTTDSCVFGSCQSLPFADLLTVRDKIDELLAVLEGPACGEEVLKRPFLKKLGKRLKKARGKLEKANGLEDVLKIPGLIEKAGVQIDKARAFLVKQATNDKISDECGVALTGFVDGIDVCLDAVPTF
jgi:hypothetical protein